MMGIDDESSGLDHGDLHSAILNSDPLRNTGVPQPGARIRHTRLAKALGDAVMLWIPF